MFFDRVMLHSRASYLQFCFVCVLVFWYSQRFSSLVFFFLFFFFKQKTAYEMQRGLVGSEMCIRDRYRPYIGDLELFPRHVPRPGGKIDVLGNRGENEIGKDQAVQSGNEGHRNIFENDGRIVDPHEQTNQADDGTCHAESGCHAGHGLEKTLALLSAQVEKGHLHVETITYFLFLIVVHQQDKPILHKGTGGHICRSFQRENPIHFGFHRQIQKRIDDLLRCSLAVRISIPGHFESVGNMLDRITDKHCGHQTGHDHQEGGQVEIGPGGSGQHEAAHEDDKAEGHTDIIFPTHETSSNQSAVVGNDNFNPSVLDLIGLGSVGQFGLVGSPTGDDQPFGINAEPANELLGHIGRTLG
eukprot:TRINITY_DN14413_c0_g1_i2.p1 TRINITY_DN14413_c0_g1~~TRINITY_DN14413_c0_g1_i2.p1  ORF type:complete len:357 (+),score=56.92 TRINITY_DN14413_c0_g1_i2:2-1072(+)